MFIGLLVFFASIQHLYNTHAASTRKHDQTPIIFPGPIQDLSNRYGSGPEPVRVPDECQGKNFCTIKPPDYPQDKFNKLFKGRKQISQASLVPEDLFDNRQGDPSEADGCETKLSYEPLYQVRASRTGDWRTVVQSPEENFIQRVRLEECRDSTTACFTIAGDLGIETFCKQKYSVWDILVSDGMNGTERVKTELPICCSCHYRL
ncbi:uncharacterized protein LOC126369435 [Pectinophora gossypiella]|uniref:uncharacterized protein LOC126369435 n=1 Tax=Pectinophora gossypiella TaxID=13191 RepID=UPI00214E825F|nr:uncharacterized protein LOC126369435 [Pectinophora gossypiella]